MHATKSAAAFSALLLLLIAPPADAAPKAKPAAASPPYQSGGEYVICHRYCEADAEGDNRTGLLWVDIKTQSGGGHSNGIGHARVGHRLPLSQEAAAVVVEVDATVEADAQAWGDDGSAESAVTLGLFARGLACHDCARTSYVTLAAQRTDECGDCPDAPSHPPKSTNTYSVRIAEWLRTPIPAGEIQVWVDLDGRASARETGLLTPWEPLQGVTLPPDLTPGPYAELAAKVQIHEIRLIPESYKASDNAPGRLRQNQTYTIQAPFQESAAWGSGCGDPCTRVQADAQTGDLRVDPHQRLPAGFTHHASYSEASVWNLVELPAAHSATVKARVHVDEARAYQEMEGSDAYSYLVGYASLFGTTCPGTYCHGYDVQVLTSAGSCPACTAPATLQDQTIELTFTLASPEGYLRPGPYYLTLGVFGFAQSVSVGGFGFNAIVTDAQVVFEGKALDYTLELDPAAWPPT